MVLLFILILIIHACKDHQIGECILTISILRIIIPFLRSYFYYKHYAKMNILKNKPTMQETELQMNQSRQNNQNGQNSTNDDETEIPKENRYKTVKVIDMSIEWNECI